MDKIATKEALQQVAKALNDKIEKLEKYLPEPLAITPLEDIIGTGYTKASISAALGISEDDLQALFDGRIAFISINGDLFNVGTPQFNSGDYDLGFFSVEPTTGDVTPMSYCIRKVTSDDSWSVIEI